MPRTNLAVRVAGSVFGIAGEMRRLPAYFDNPVTDNNFGTKIEVQLYMYLSTTRMIAGVIHVFKATAVSKILNIVLCSVTKRSPGLLQ